MTSPCLVLSRLTQVADPSGTYGFTYDHVGRLAGTSTVYSFLTRTLTTSYGYDAASNRVSLAAPGSNSVSYSYDTLNRLTGITGRKRGQEPFVLKDDAVECGYGESAASGCGRNGLPRMEPR